MGQKEINARGRAYIAGLAATVKALWALACKEDGIPADASFVVFSDGNRANKLHDVALTRLWEAQREYAAGGYVGLRINAGRAC